MPKLPYCCGKDLSCVMQKRHQRAIQEEAVHLIGVADDTGTDLIEETKVGDAAGRPVPEGHNGYTLVGGRLVKV